MTYHDILRRITAVYDSNEARAIVRMLVEEMFGMTHADMLTGAIETLSAADTARLSAAVSRIAAGEPLQHVLGYAYFCCHRFGVNKTVLIPRPETEWLVNRAHTLLAHTERPRILDIGTGSGCIAVSMKLAQPEAYVEAWDISPDALRTARANAEALGADVCFRQRDALAAPDHTCAPGNAPKWNCIVSNPPYICQSEQTDMHDNVLRHEPHTALFVPDDDPLRFYRAIAHYAMAALEPGGTLLFECNTRFVGATADMLSSMGFGHVTQSDDCFGMPRFVEATKR